jgi:plastocyanin
MQRRAIVLAGTILSAAILLGIAAVSAARADDANVVIDNFTFSPAEITVAAGTKVSWSNRDDIPHTVTDAGQPRAFKSPPLDTGDAFSFVFSSPGTYHYFCTLHPHMQGTVVVK